MTILQFIDKAIEGGWSGVSPIEPEHASSIPAMLLDPEAWKALGKVEGWNKYDTNDESHDCDALGCSSIEHRTEDRWLHHFAQMPLALAEGKTIEQFLETL